MKRVFGRQTRRSLGAAMKICVPALATQPVPMVVIGERTKRITSWMASPDSTWPPGEEMRTLIGASDSSASAIRRVQVARAVWWLISPNTSTKRDLKASRSTTASVRSVGSGLSSLASMPEWYNGSATRLRFGYIFSGYAQALRPCVRSRPHRQGIRRAAPARQAAEDSGVRPRPAAELRARRPDLPFGARGAALAARALHRGRDARRRGALDPWRAAAPARHARRARLRPCRHPFSPARPLGCDLQDQRHRLAGPRPGLPPPARARAVA